MLGTITWVLDRLLALIQGWRRVRLDETWEECIPTDRVAHILEVEHAGRVRLSNGKIIRSRPNRNLLPVGRVAGHGSA